MLASGFEEIATRRRPRELDRILRRGIDELRRL
jgi:hypothetical protein